MRYQAPLEDMHFILHELVNLKEHLTLPGFEEITPELIEAVLQENARFTEQEIAPLNAKGDKHPAYWEDGHVSTSPGFQTAYKQFVQGGWQGLGHASRLGGQGLPKVVAACTNENLNAASLAFGLCPMLTDGVIETLAIAASEEQQNTYIPPLLQGRWTGTMNLTEAQAGSDLSQVAARAVLQEDGSYRLFGQKIFITFGEHDLAENIIHLVLARTPDAPKGIKGISLFIVPKFLVNSDGSLGARNDVWCASIENKLGIHASPTAMLVYGSGQGEVGEGAIAYRVGAENQGLKQMFVMMNASRFAVGIQGVALAERALQNAQAYAYERIQSTALAGSNEPVSIAKHPDVQRILMTMRALTEGSRALAYTAAALSDVAQYHDSEEERKLKQAAYEFLVPVVKGFTTESAVEVASLGIQVLGGIGYIEEADAAQFYRDARILPIYEGTTAIQANDFIKRKLLRDKAAIASYFLTAMAMSQGELQEFKDHAEHGLAIQQFIKQFEQAVQRFKDATLLILEHYESSPNAVFVGSVPYLMLAGTCLAGWQMLRAAIACMQQFKNGRNTDFHTKKLAVCMAYASLILPRAELYFANIDLGRQLYAYIKQV